MRDAENAGNPLARAVRPGPLVRFALPSVVMMLFMGLYTVVDTVFVSRFVNTAALSALNIVCPVVNLIVGLGTMFATGGSALVATKMGAGDETRASRDFTFLVLAGIVTGVLLLLAGFLWMDDIIWGLGASELLFPYCKDYLNVLMFFVPMSMLQVLFQSFFVVAGRPGLGMLLAIGAGVINVLLDYLFMVPLNMGIAGSALGTGLGYTVPAAVGIVFFFFSKGNPRFIKPKLDWRVLTKSCANGFSEMAGQLATAVTTFLFNAAMMRLLGENGVAAITILIYTQFLLTAFYIGFSMGVAPVISYQFGRGGAGCLKRIFRICLSLIAASSVILFLAAMLFGAPLVRIFSPEGTRVYEIAREGFLIFPFSFLFSGLNIFSSAAFTALSNGKVSAVISLLRTFVFVLLALLSFPYLWGVAGVWLAIPFAELCASFFSAGFLRNAVFKTA